MVAATGFASQERRAKAAAAGSAGGRAGGTGGARDIQSLRAVHLAATPLELRISHPCSLRFGRARHPALCRCVMPFLALSMANAHFP